MRQSSDESIQTVSFVSLGCPKNLVDSEKMLGLLAEDGIAPVSHEAPDQIVEGATHEHGAEDSDDLSRAGSEQDFDYAGRITPADAVVINTCGFLEASKQESLGVIKEALAAKDRGEVKRVVVAGCLVQRHRAKMLDWAPGIDAMVGVFDRDKIIEAVRGFAPQRTTIEQELDKAPKYWISANALVKAESTGAKTVGLTVQGKDGKGIGYFESDAARLRLTPRHYAYLRISEGCNQACAFCTIPSIRGKMRSKREPEILTEARELLRDGAFELLLIGQDTTSYGDDIGTGLHQVDGADPYRAGLPKLLKSLSDVVSQETGRGWLRLMYAYPTTFGDETIDAFAKLCETGHLIPYLDIPLQHASDNMLTAMRRHVRADLQRDLILKLRERVPGMAVRTTFITGFPGETEADHQQLLEFIEEVGFEAVGVFRYSKEEGTPAGRMETDPALAVPDDIKRRRQAEILELQQRLCFEQNEFLAEQFDPEDPENTGLRFDVLIDDPKGQDEEGRHISAGRTYFQAPKIDANTFVQSRERLSPGELVRCTIIGADGYDLIAVPTDELAKRVSLPMFR
jgi:ribosomal protein S12 methylthiotransferase